MKPGMSIVDEIMNELRGHAIEVPAVYGDGEKTTEKNYPSCRGQSHPNHDV